VKVIKELHIARSGLKVPYRREISRSNYKSIVPQIVKGKTYTTTLSACWYELWIELHFALHR
jgi:hypothetical protein